MDRVRWMGREVARFLLAGVFLWAGGGKVLHPGFFYGDILSYQILPEAWAVVVAWYLPWLEIVLAVALFVPRWVGAASAGLCGLMVVFAMGLLSAWWRGLDISCGCFGVSSLHNQYGWWLLRDGVLLGLGICVGWAGWVSGWGEELR